MPFLGTTPTQGFVSSFPKQSFTPDGSTTVFTLTNPVATANDLEVFVGNVRQEPTAAYSAAGTTLTMTEAPATGLNFYVINKSFAQVTTNPPDGSVSSEKLATTLDLSGTGRTGHGGLKSVQVFTSSGTYTKPAGINTVKVIVTGAGGQGGGYGANNDFGAGGGAGGTAIEVIDISGVSTVAVTVGSGGNGANSTSNGNAGGASSFGSYCTGNPGSGGRHGNIGSTYGGAGGSATGGDINIEGGSGNNGIDNMYNGGGTDYRPTWGIGGASFWGGGGRGGVYNVTPATGKAYGSGGGGGASPSTSAGAAGQSGVVYVEEYA